MQHKVVNRVREIRIAKGLSQDQVGSRIGKVRGQISSIESGKIKLTENWLNLLSNALECSPAELVADINAMKEVPIIGDVPGGNLIEAIQREPEGFIEFNSKRPNLRALLVKGNSMSRIAPHGVYIIADFDESNPSTLNNQPVVCCIEQHGLHECSFKIYKRNPDRFEPYSIEPGYDTIFPNGNPWKIYAKVIGTVGFIGHQAEFVSIEHRAA